MKKYHMTLPAALLALGLFIPNGYAGGGGSTKTVFQFLTVGTDARAAAMGDAFTSMTGNSNSIFYNPANLARMKLFPSVSISQNSWIADITYRSASAAFDLKPIAQRDLGVLALSFLYVDYGEFLGTEFDATTGKGYVDTGKFSPNAYALGIGYARRLTDILYVGGHVKYVSQSFDLNARENSLSAWAFDLGVYYKNLLKTNLNFALAVRNQSFSKNIKFGSEEFESTGCELPLNFTTGVSMNVSDLFKGKSDSSKKSVRPKAPKQQNVPKTHNLLVSANVSFPRGFSNRIHVGGEYNYDNIALRLGYEYNINETIQTGQNDENGVTVGLGLQPAIGGKKVDIDYAYTPFGVLDDVHRLSLSFSF